MPKFLCNISMIFWLSTSRAGPLSCLLIRKVKVVSLVCKRRLPTVNMDDVDDDGISVLQQQLREKELRLTDVQLEALSSAHRLQQMQDAMKRLKASSAFIINTINRAGQQRSRSTSLQYCVTFLSTFACNKLHYDKSTFLNLHSLLFLPPRMRRVDAFGGVRHFWYASTSLECLGQIRISRSSSQGQGQGHRNKNGVDERN